MFDETMWFNIFVLDKIAPAGTCRCVSKLKRIAKDLKKAVEWYTKSAEQGNAGAQNNLGLCYDNGEGVAKDLKKAVEWYTKSAEQVGYMLSVD